MQETVMKQLFACVLLAAASALAGAQSLPYGVSIDNLAATRQADGTSSISGTVVNHGDKPLNRLSVTFVLFDDQGREIGRTGATRDMPLAPGETWQLVATTPHTFSRFTALDIQAQ
ncbi:hypothetical protein CAL19_16855 [Bordetella genomosp. 7]|uniref:DUF3426 domain-containing protein n=2 Tax=Bordetella genomosp. 7 TaxID=1416805 RepID=A0A261QVH2_9BORD|nr:hypothetical protein CAL19_16855 [Bordetella genomosp. 7]